jgi:hypothetical protein
MIIPSNNILTDQYTRGEEFSIKNTGEIYKGYYCIVQGNKFYTGKIYTSLSEELIKLSQFQDNNLPPTSITPEKNLDIIRYFIKKINVFPIIIKEVDKNTYESLTSSFYAKVSIAGNQIYLGSQLLEEAEKKMSGLKSFLSAELEFSVPYE